MAKTAVLLSVYGANGTGFGPAQGTLMSFPANSIMLRSIPATVYQGVTCNTSVQLLPSGLQLNQPQYYVAPAIGTIVTDINT